MFFTHVTQTVLNPTYTKLMTWLRPQTPDAEIFPQLPNEMQLRMLALLDAQTLLQFAQVNRSALALTHYLFALRAFDVTHPSRLQDQIIERQDVLREPPNYKKQFHLALKVFEECEFELQHWLLVLQKKRDLSLINFFEKEIKQLLNYKWRFWRPMTLTQLDSSEDTLKKLHVLTRLFNAMRENCVRNQTNDYYRNRVMKLRLTFVEIFLVTQANKQTRFTLASLNAFCACIETNPSQKKLQALEVFFFQLQVDYRKNPQLNFSNWLMQLLEELPNFTDQNASIEALKCAENYYLSEMHSANSTSYKC